MQWFCLATSCTHARVGAGGVGGQLNQANPPGSTHSHFPSRFLPPSLFKRILGLPVSSNVDVPRTSSFCLDLTPPAQIVLRSQSIRSSRLLNFTYPQRSLHSPHSLHPVALSLRRQPRE
ncbi:hypothetical protein GY45DRAFT_1324541 [Cubamyces sp. BRFM 1775]|nr:hypothetical protein GY45DRAFT_1324541 [Cubamyces sp. BRFM 1775]